MRAGKKTYINRVRANLKEYEEIDCNYKSGMATEQICLKLDNFLILTVEYQPYQEHTFSLTLTPNYDNTTLFDTFGGIVQSYSNVFKDTPKREFKSKIDFEKYIDNCISYIKPTYNKVRLAMTNHIKELIKNKKTMKRLLSDNAAVEYISKFSMFDENEIQYLYSLSGNENFLPEEVRDIFLF